MWSARGSWLFVFCGRLSDNHHSTKQNFCDHPEHLNFVFTCHLRQYNNKRKYRCMLIEDTKVICLVLVSVLHEHRLIPHPKARTAIISERQDDIDHLYRESMSCCSPPWICSTRKIRLRRRQPPTTSDCPAPQVNKTRRIPPQNVQINGNWCYVAVQAQ